MNVKAETACSECIPAGNDSHCGNTEVHLKGITGDEGMCRVGAD
jgi:hypothetical protein